MRRIPVAPRPGWRQLAARLGFRHHTTALGAYWCEEACFQFDVAEIESDLRPAIEAVWSLCLAVMERASRDDEILSSLGIPEAGWDPLRESWERRDPTLCTRFDFAYGDGGPPKLHECNADAPGVLYESAAFQWIWLEDRLDHGVIAREGDQFNRIHQALVEAFAGLPSPRQPIHFTASRLNIEDQVWAAYLRDCAHQAGRPTGFVATEEIGVDRRGRLCDLDARLITHLVKAYRWELLLREEFGPHIAGAGAPMVLEPLWKLVLSSKGILVWLWRLFPDHPNLLPCWFEDEPAAPTGRCVVKPLFSVKGRNIRLCDPTLPGGRVSTSGPYGREGHVVQALHRLATFARPGGESHASVTGWIVAGRAEGIGVLESDGPVIDDETCRFVPHVVLG
ncbi:MAG: glutathionylspermidine synthase family protein [Alphaproteobacteria bacterium]|nr:glutathionylspermidine synthase family protein [Alphaproteobacteria bacterium]